jgi:hypothetical protein
MGGDHFANRGLGGEIGIGDEVGGPFFMGFEATSPCQQFLGTGSRRSFTDSEKIIHGSSILSMVGDAAALAARSR